VNVIRLWRQLRAVKAVGQAANEAATRETLGAGKPQRGFAAAFGNIMADMLAPRMAAMAERRGGPLPGSDVAVVSGSAWAQPLASGAAAVRSRDAAFDPAALEQFAGQVFAAVVGVWAGADVGSVRPVLSDALWEPLAATTGLGTGHAGPEQYFAMQRASAQIGGLHTGSWYDSALVIMHARLDFVGERPPPGMPDQMMRWDESWLFQRSVRPGGDPMARPQSCPACGGPTQVNDAGLCVHCQEPMPFLTTGWLATEIVSHHPIYAEMREQVRADPGLFENVPPGMRRLLAPDLRGEFQARTPPDTAP